MFTEPLSGWRKTVVSERRTAVDWATEIKHLLDNDYPDSDKVILVCDQLNDTVGELNKAPRKLIKAVIYQYKCSNIEFSLDNRAISVDQKVFQESHQSVVSARRTDLLNSPQNLACGNRAAMPKARYANAPWARQRRSLSDCDRSEAQTTVC